MGSLQAADLAFTSIPILDLSLASFPETKSDFLQQLRYALTSVGFLYVKNHGVPQGIVDSLTSILPSLFHIPQSEKDSIDLHNSPHFLGFSNVGSETTAGKTDLREQFEFANELPETWKDTGEIPLYERLKGPNQWPKSNPVWRTVIEEYIDELTGLGDRFLSLVAEALELPLHTFHPFLSEQHRLKIVRYPLCSDHASLSQGVGPHKDSSGWWTFLLQASPDTTGLEALNKSNQWIPVPPIPGTFVVNIGQAFEVVTHGICKATTHRVVSGQKDRYSVPFFQGVRGSLTKREALEALDEWANTFGNNNGGRGDEGDDGRKIDSAFLKGKYETWGESQLRTKIRSHREVGKRFYGDDFEKYIHDG